jgi:MFS family permease
VLLIMFVFVEARQEEPLLPLSLFSDRNFSLANAVSAIVAFGMLGLFLPLTIFLQSILGLSALDAGIAIVPMALTSMVVAPIAGNLADRLSARWILCLGLVLYAIGMGLVVWVSNLNATGATFTIPLIIAGIGMGCTFAPMVTVAMRNISPVQAGAASGFINTVRQVGGTVGSAVVGAVLQNQLATNMHAQAVKYAAQSHLPSRFTSGFVQALSNAGSQGFHLGRGQAGGTPVIPASVPKQVAEKLTILGQEVYRHAYLNSMRPSLTLPICVLALGAVVTLFMRTSRRTEEVAAGETARQPVAVGE